MRGRTSQRAFALAARPRRASFSTPRACLFNPRPCMLPKLLTSIFGSRNDRLLKQYRQVVQRINALESSFEALSDDALRAKTAEFRTRVSGGESLDALLPEAFAAVREGGKRVLKMRHFDVQLIGGMVLNDGKIAEMRTGEGKTLMATLPVYLNLLTGKGVHLVTVNDYLARRDAEWMGRLYSFLGLTVGVNTPQMSREEKQAAYAADITYGTNNEFGFDYLRDNMVQDTRDRVARGLSYAIVDEVDSILIDEARTPLIISGQAEDHTELYVRINAVVPKLKKQIGELDLRTGEGVIDPGDFTVDEKSHQVFLTEDGHENAERLLREAGLLVEGASLYDPANITLMHHVYAALRARHLYNRDQHYVVQPGEDGRGEVVIVDEFTGRLMTGRRWSDGLHQAVEAKEGVAIQSENQTLASITFQNYFRMYGKLSGMTGTADTEAYEFQEIYGLETVVIPPNLPTIRKDELDLVYKTSREKFEAVTEDIRDCHTRGQPVLVGTTSIENSELISGLLDKTKLPHNVLNAKQHAREAEIVAQAGRPGRDHDRHQHGRPRHRHRARRQRREPDQDHRCRRDDSRIGQDRPRRPAHRRVAGPARLGEGPGRPAHHRHRAARVAAHRQPAARPLRAPGRSGLVAFLSLAR